MTRLRATRLRALSVSRWPPLLRLLALNLLAGIAAALLFVGGLLALNPWRLRDLILADGTPAAALAMLAFGFAITLGSAAMGTAIMAIGGDETARGGGRPAKANGALAPAYAAKLDPSP